MQRVGYVGRAGMFGPYIASIHDLQSCRVERSEQLRSWPQAQVLRQVRKDYPALTPWLQVRGQRAQEPTQHATLGVVDPLLDGRTRSRGNPGWVANHERGPPFGKEIRLYHFHLLRQPETLEVLASACQCARIPVGGDHAHDAAP